MFSVLHIGLAIASLEMSLRLDFRMRLSLVLFPVQLSESVSSLPVRHSVDAVWSSPSGHLENYELKMEKKIQVLICVDDQYCETVSGKIATLCLDTYLRLPILESCAVLQVNKTETKQHRKK